MTTQRCLRIASPNSSSPFSFHFYFHFSFNLSFHFLFYLSSHFLVFTFTFFRLIAMTTQQCLRIASPKSSSPSLFHFPFHFIKSLSSTFTFRLIAMTTQQCLRIASPNRWLELIWQGYMSTFLSLLPPTAPPPLPRRAPLL